MNKNHILKFYEHLKENQLPKDLPQEAAGYGSKRYTADMWTLEVCEYLLGIENNPNCPTVRSKAKHSLYESLEKVKQDADQICVGEVGRGLDIVIANMMKEWKVICYDHNPIYQEYLDKYFKSVEFYTMPTNAFVESELSSIKEKTIFIIDNTKLRNFKSLEANKNIVHLIFYGKLLW